MSAEIMTALARIEGKIDALAKKPAASQATKAATAGAVAPDSDLEGKYGDPLVRMLIPAFKWSGTQYKGKQMSEVPDPDFLEAYAAQLEWSADQDETSGKTYVDKNGETKKSDGKLQRNDAARARGWAKRKRGGWKPAPTSNAALFGNDTPPPGDDDIPFITASPLPPLDRWRQVF